MNTATRWLDTAISSARIATRKWNIVGFSIALFVLALCTPIFIKLQNGSKDTTADYYVKNNYGNMPSYFVKVKFEKLHFTGIEQVTIRKKYGVEQSRSTSAKYYVGLIGERVILIKATGNLPEEPTSILEGWLEDIPSEVRTQALNPIISELQKKNVKVVQEYMLDLSTNYDVVGWLWYLSLVVALVFLALAYFVHKQIQTPETYKAVKKYLAGQTSHQNYQDLADDIESSISQAVRYSKGFVTSEWLLFHKGSKVRFFQHKELLWVYGGKEKSAEFVQFEMANENKATKYIQYKTEKLQISSSEWQHLILAVKDQAPWCVYGYDVDIERDWKANRHEFRNFVQQRYVAFQSPPTEQENSQDQNLSE